MHLTPEEQMIVALVRRAIRDAKESRCEKLRAEAATWLWSVAPTVARQARPLSARRETILVKVIHSTHCA